MSSKGIIKTINKVDVVGIYGGQLFDIVNVQDDQIDSWKIARALQRLCRYSGHSEFFWSVGQHSLLVEKIMEDQGCSAEACLAGLIHDFSEAFINDLVTPIKAKLPDYYKYEAIVSEAIAKHYGLKSIEDYPAYKRADKIALYAEARRLFGTHTEWAYAWRDEFMNPRCQRYSRFVQPDYPEIVVGRILTKLIELLDKVDKQRKRVKLTWREYVTDISKSEWYNELMGQTLKKYRDELGTKYIPVMKNQWSMSIWKVNGTTSACELIWVSLDNDEREICRYKEKDSFKASREYDALKWV